MYSRKETDDSLYLPPPCIICVGFKYACYTVLLVIVLGYIGKAMFIAHENNESYWNAIWHWEFWTWDTTFFFYAFGFLVIVYGLVLLTIVTMRFVFRCYLYDEYSKKPPEKKPLTDYYITEWIEEV